MISNSYRFHGHGSLRYVYKNGSTDRTRWFMVRYTANNRRKKPRVAVIVSKKVYKSAVKRNRIRRRVYEIIRNSINDQTPVMDVVLTVYSPEVLTATPDEVNQQINHLLVNIGFMGDKSDEK